MIGLRGFLPKTPTLFNGVLMALNTAKTFSMEIERIAIEKNITHMEAVLDYCHSLKEKIEANARDLNFLPRQAQLPV
jgi:hypothetical protein